MVLDDGDKGWISAQLESLGARFTDFRSFAYSDELRLRSHEARIRSIEERLDDLTDRISKLEQAK